MEFITQNTKKEVKIIPASFQDALELKKAVMKCIGELETAKSFDLNNLSNIELTGLLDILIAGIINLETSNFFEKAIFKCLEVCTYDKFHAITRQLFDDKPEIREDYYEIISKCAEVNLTPFFKSLVSELQTRFKTINSNDQE